MRLKFKDNTTVGGAVYHRGAVAEVSNEDHARVLVERGHAEKASKGTPETPGGKVEAPKAIVAPPGGVAEKES